MYNKRSDFAQNKNTPDRIIYQTVNGPITLTPQDFDSEEEFLRWKAWSDENYHETKREGRFADQHLELNEFVESTAVLLDFMDQARAEGVSEEKLKIEAFRIAYQYGRRTLTRTQRRRLMLFANGMSMTDIAKAEGVKKQSVHESLSAAKRKLIRFVKKLQR